MGISKKTRQLVYDKFDGKCAYTGKPLGNDWQVDHAIPKYMFPLIEGWDGVGVEDLKVDDFSNLLPALKIVNHYKRAKTINSFRAYLMNFHLRLAKLPKKPTVQKSVNRIKYMNDIASAFDITVDKPFSGVFYFEKVADGNK